MTTHPTALVVGESLIDIVHRADGTIDEHPGGSPANVAITLGRLGRPIRLLTWMGVDAYGRLIQRWLSGSNVDLIGASTGAAHTSLATARLDVTGAATYEFDLEWRLPDTPPIPESTLVVHTGSIAATLPPGADHVLELVTRARPTASVTYDPNVRPAIVGPPAAARERVEAMVALSDVVKVSDEDLAWLYPGIEARSSAAAWHKRTGAPVIMTRGEQGAVAWTASGVIEVLAPVTQVADTVGAGDSFMGALIDGLWTADLLGAARRADLRAIDTPTLARILERCVRVAAITVSRAGANPPRAAELEELEALG
ncbi:MAG: carbohydrate kinase family protein [Cellulomonadaceae bacterium]